MVTFLHQAHTNRTNVWRTMNEANSPKTAAAGVNVNTDKDPQLSSAVSEYDNQEQGDSIQNATTTRTTISDEGLPQEEEGQQQKEGGSTDTIANDTSKRDPNISHGATALDSRHSADDLENIKDSNTPPTTSTTTSTENTNDEEEEEEEEKATKQNSAKTTQSTRGGDNEPNVNPLGQSTERISEGDDGVPEASFYDDIGFKNASINTPQELKESHRSLSGGIVVDGRDEDSFCAEIDYKDQVLTLEEIKNRVTNVTDDLFALSQSRVSAPVAEPISLPTSNESAIPFADAFPLNAPDTRTPPASFHSFELDVENATTRQVPPSYSRVNKARMVSFALFVVILGVVLLSLSLTLEWRNGDSGGDTSLRHNSTPPVPTDCKGCSNPYHVGGCLYQKLIASGQQERAQSYIRTCHSDDDDELLGKCHRPSPQEESLFEIRIASRSYPEYVAHAWILQILLTEIMRQPVTIESGQTGPENDFYNRENGVLFDESSFEETLETAHELAGDCSSALRPCAHITSRLIDFPDPIVSRMELESIIVPRQELGFTQTRGLFIPKFTAERDPSLQSYPGYSGEENRKKMAQTFLRPFSWFEYCSLISMDSCATPDETSSRAPRQGSDEEARYYVSGSYNGYFGATDENDCVLNPTTCTGHVVDAPCNIASALDQHLFHLDIALEGTTLDYQWEEITEIIHAANATRSNVAVAWWLPQTDMYQYLGTDTEFQVVQFPEPSEQCIAARAKDSTLRCDPETNQTERYGSAEGVCNEPPYKFYRLVTERLRQEHPKAFEAISRLVLDNTDIEQILRDWTWLGPREATCAWAFDNLERLESFIS